MDPARIRELLSGLSCPLCGGTRGDTLLIVIDAPNAGGGTVRVQCVRCHLFWSFVIELGQGIGPEQEVAPTASDNRPPISADEVLELHTILRDLEGPLTELLPRAS